jgi:hypothetical protein
VECVGDNLRVLGCLPMYREGGHTSDLISEYQSARKRSISKGPNGKNSPHIRFANAESDDDLIAFVRSFGPVVARSVHLDLEPPVALTAMQDMRELRNERSIYRAALSLIMELSRPRFDYDAARSLIGEVADKLPDWHRQWEREREESEAEPVWKLNVDSRRRIEGLGRGRPSMLLAPQVDARIVVCELLNAFRPIVFPNPAELNASIRFGIRPLLYAILRREFLHPHDTGVCANVQCRDFFEIERAGQQFCSVDCSRRQRQREYWKKQGKRRRTYRLKERKKLAGRS